MAEIAFAVVAATVSAVAVFLPLTFLTDETGRLFREFAVTVAAALTVSGFVAVTLSPALCALVVRPHTAEHGIKALFARLFERLAAAYGRTLAPVLARPGLWVAGGAAWVALGVLLIPTVEQELIPKSDRGLFFAFTQAPEGSTIEYMDRYQQEGERMVRSLPEVRRLFSVIALGIGTPGLVNQGLLIASLKDADERERSQQEIVNDIRPELERIAGITAFPTNPSMVSGFGASPVQFVVEGEDLGRLAAWGEEIEKRIIDYGGFGNVQTNLYLNKPQLEVSIDRERASDLGVSVRQISSALQILLGGLDLSTFKLGGETYNVMAQLERDERNDPRDLLELYVRGNQDQLVALSSVIDTRETIAPREIPHYDRQRSVTVSADLATRSQGEGIQIASRIAEDVLPEGVSIRFTGEAEKFLESSNALIFAYALAIVVVFLVLAAQFESFVHPFTILVAVALSFTGAILALLVTNTTLNLFSKIGLVMLVGLVTKNSILIVEFANQLRDRGEPLLDAVFHASRTRFRPILMTALATMVGILPIALGRGAGGDSRAPLGIAVLGGMLFSTLLTFFVVPATYVVIARARERLGRRVPAERPEGARPAAVPGS
jgi:multidrug efflux pump